MNLVILASGQSSRMGCDKGFLTLQGQSLISRQIELVRSIVPGTKVYLVISKEVYERNTAEILRLVSEGVDTIYNPYDSRSHTNVYTMMHAINNIEKDDTIICDSDIVVDFESMYKLVKSSFGVLTRESDNPEEYYVDKNHCIVSCYKITDALVHNLPKLHHELRGFKYYDDILLKYKPEYIYSNAMEFDTPEELIYSGLLSTTDVKHLVEKSVHIDKAELGMSNDTYIVGDSYLKIFRKSTDAIVHRGNEFVYHDIFHQKGLTSFMMSSPDLGFSINKTLEGSHPTNVDIDKFMNMLRTADLRTTHHYDSMYNQLRLYLSKVNLDIEKHSGIEWMIQELDKFMESDSNGWEICHGDLVPANILEFNGSYKLIDFEYSCCRSLCWDEATLCLEFNKEPSSLEVKKYMIAVDYIWYVWSMMEGFVDKYYEYGINRLNRAIKNYEEVFCNE